MIFYTSEFRTVFFNIYDLILFLLYLLLRRGLGGSECAINRQLNGPYRPGQVGEVGQDFPSGN